MIFPATLITVEQLEKKDSSYSLMPGSIFKVKLVTAKDVAEDMLADGPAIPLFVVNDAEGYTGLRYQQIEGGEPLLFRLVVDREISSFAALLVYTV